MGDVRLEHQGPVAVLTIDAPPMNALDRPLIARLDECIAHCAADQDVRALVLRGAGERAFSVGSDLYELAQLIGRGPQAIEHKFAQDEKAFGALASIAKPSVAAIEGAAVGGGLELAVCCDLVVTARGARLALPEIALGAFPGSGGTVRVTRRVGPGRARRMMLLGDPVPTDQALAWGLVDELAEPGHAFEQALGLAQRLAAGPALALAGCKASIDAALAQDESAALDFATRRAVELAFSADLAEGLSAFRERRRPAFAGR